ncbi:MAG: hypothetical protein HS104_20550 [Polyangiaceae bacterium]|nr:hypothetical protein [Polyangiaceae bacterium]MCE7893801.1 hypothetical protein [Sorangiineae bacterium PRO1]MCL4752655.1 hypothetical protein [Myxococcales bacterium]
MNDSRFGLARAVTVARSLSLALALGIGSASAQSPPDEPTSVVQARDAFRLGAGLAEAGQWKDALAAFQRSAKLRPHATTTYNLAFCERALGRYTRARKLLLLALEQSRAAPTPELTPSLETQAKAYLSEAEQKLARVSLSLDDRALAVSVDGRPLELDRTAPRPVLVAGVREPGPGEALPATEVELVIDPGAHVFVITKADASRVLNLQVEPGATDRIELCLGPKPARAAAQPDRPDATWPILAFGVGAAGVAVGTLTGLAALQEKSSLDDHCTRGIARCDARYQRDIDAMNRYAVVSTASFGVGLVGLGLGAYLLLSTPSADATRESAKLRLLVGPTGGSVFGRF